MNANVTIKIVYDQAHKVLGAQIVSHGHLYGNQHVLIGYPKGVTIDRLQLLDLFLPHFGNRLAILLKQLSQLNNLKQLIQSN